MIEHVKTKIKEEDNKVVISRFQDVQSILDFNREKQIDGPRSNSGLRHVGQIPFVVVEKLLRDSGLKLGSPEFAEYIKDRIKSGDYSKLVIHGY